MNNLVQSSLEIEKELSTADLPHGIKGVVEVASVPWLLILLIILIFSAFMMIFWRWKISRKCRNPSPRTSLATFLIGLKELDLSELSGDLDHRNAWHKLTAGLKFFLEDVLGVPATDSTSEELTELLGAHAGLSELQKQKLRELFIRADLVKFAGIQVGKSELRDWIVLSETIAKELFEKKSNSAAPGGESPR